METGENEEAIDKSVEERRADVAAFISSELHLVSRYLWERERANEAINEFEARPYQQEAWERLWKARGDGKTEALLHLATGLGKTSIAVLDYAKFRSEIKEDNPNASPRALFVVHQNNILDQASERFQAFMPEMTQSYFSSKNRDPQTELTLATFQTLVRSGHTLPPDRFDYIVYDEAHHIEADTYKRVVEYFQPKFQLGMTATPERMDSRDITEHFGEAIYSKTLPEAIREKLLAKVDYKIMLDKTVEDTIKNGFEPHSMKELRALFDTAPRNYEIAQEIRQAQAEIMGREHTDSVKTIIFCENIEHADIIAEFVSGESYHSGLTDSEQTKVLSAFRSGGLKTAVVRDMFNEGIDIPDARLIVMIRSTQSKTIFEQQLGRGLRKAPGKEQVSVLDFVGNADRLLLLNEFAEQVFEEGLSEGDEGEQDSRSIDFNGNSFIFSKKVVDVLRLYEKLHPRQINHKWASAPNDEIVAAALSISPDKPLRGRDIEALSRDEFPALSTIFKRFGDMYAFYEACGFKVNDWRNASNEAIIQRALEISPDEPLTSDQINSFDVAMFPYLSLIYKRFNSLSEFHRQCGFDVVAWGKISNDDLIKIALHLSPKKPLTKAAIHELDRSIFPSEVTVVNRFGSMKEFHKQCGFDTAVEWASFDDQDLIDLALQISPNSPLTIRKINALPRTEFPGYDHLLKRFGSMPNFQQACGFTVRPRWMEYTNEQLGELARELIPDRPFTIHDFDSLSSVEFPSLAFITKRFGNLDNLRIASGFETRTRWEDYSEEEIIALAKEVSPAVPMSPTLARKLGPGKFPTPNTIYAKFGSFEELNRLCGYSHLRVFKWQNQSNQELIAIANNLYPGQPLTLRMMNNADHNDFPSAGTILRRFGTIAEFNHARGL